MPIKADFANYITTFPSFSAIKKFLTLA